MTLSALSALSPLDGRYASRVAALRPLMSEFGLMHRRVQVEVEWFIALSDAGFAEFQPLPEASRGYLRSLVLRFSEADAQAIKDMTGPWQPADYTDRFSEAILALVNQKVEAGETATVTALEDASATAGTMNVVDLTALLAQSLAKRKPASLGDGGSRSAAVTATKAAVKASTRRRA